MSKQLVCTKTPEDVEIGAKRAELAGLESRFAELEVDLITTRSALQVFERHYLQALGSRFAELDTIEAEIARIEAERQPHNPVKQRQAAEAQERAEETARAASSNNNSTTAGDFVPWDDLKKMYRDAAKRIHPDLATDPADRPRREQVMGQVNAAYESGDVERLRQILQEWEASPEALAGDGAGAELIRLIRRIAQITERLAVVESELAILLASELWQLKERVAQGAAHGQDLLKDMSLDLDRQIGEARTRLLKLKAPIRPTRRQW